MKTLSYTFVALMVILIGLLILDSGVLEPRMVLRIASDPENRALEPLIQDWAGENDTDIEITYRNSTGIARELAKGTGTDFDAVWPASSLWIALGDTQKVVQHDVSVSRSPVVLGLRTSIAKELGWIGRSDVTVQDIHTAAKEGKFRLSMTSATQSDSGALAYFGFLHALSDTSDALTMETLVDTTVLDDMRDLLAQVDRTAGDADWLAQALIDNGAVFDAMINTEALLIDANQKLIAEGREPLYAIYPADGLAMADSPIGYISKGDADKEARFLELRAFLTTPEVLAVPAGQGRRVDLAEPDTPDADPAIWNPDWGIDLDRTLVPAPTPSSEVTAEALRLYQTDLRKPSLTVWLLDVSGSSGGTPIQELKDAVATLLDPDAAAARLLQPSPRDVTILIPYNHNILDPIIIEGDQTTASEQARRLIDTLQADGGMDVFYALYEGFEAFRPQADDGTLSDFLPAIIAVIDGPSDTETRTPLLAHMDQTPYTRAIPIHTIAMGDADPDQLAQLTRLSAGRLFTGGKDLAEALWAARGYN
ncbi:vWA domain-containing protein [Antarctobacter heliothermus]|uniref:Ca-activated chloride channel family protein n=1 Tax=Antarctobacter heliothermus TaxID=74033 RepID=A0A239IFI8_9RHOB|nr:VWA domain-containing protein [Antarctobacter heliothermus]SNS92299.1 Ca-activated chloride channel family protein [Antarctobacter heliothermus]